ncbi:HupE/UreJ family protein [Kaarinaea lacus]
MMQRVMFLLLGFCLVGTSHADEIRPGYLELKETNENIFSVVWKVPAKGDKKLKLEALLPANCAEKSSPNAQFIGGAYIARWIVSCEGGIVEQPITVDGLQFTSTDVLLRLEFLNSGSQTARLTPAGPTYIVAAESSTIEIIGTYLWLGVEHILLGIDHLLFVFALLIIVSGVRRLVWTITAFTIAHSITLAGATLGYVHVPQQPVEAIIALSILFLATEIIHSRRGRVGYAERWPWMVAFIFGLLHGFGFAGALAEVGLPEQAIPLALVFFNVGVELGQLFFVGVVLSLGWLFHRIKAFPLQPAELVTTYVIGSIAAFWTIERVAGFWS